MMAEYGQCAEASILEKSYWTSALVLANKLAIHYKIGAEIW